MALKETVERLRIVQVERQSPADIVERWQSDVSQLYDHIAEWLSPFVEDGGMELQRRSKTTFEDETGPYDIEQLDIDVGHETVRLDPQGVIVIGARGRIDMTHLGSGDPVLLVLTGPGDQPNWVIVDRSTRSSLTPLTKDSFENALDKMLDEYSPRSGPTM